MELALVLLRDNGDRRRFKLAGDVVTLGRREDCDLRIPLGDVSRRHCSILWSGDEVVIKDLGSSNGTYVNGKRIREARLRPGDLIRVGSLKFVLQIDGEPSEEQIGQQTLAAPDEEVDGESSANHEGDHEEASTPGGSGDGLDPSNVFGPDDSGVEIDVPLDPSDVAEVEHAEDERRQEST